MKIKSLLFTACSSFLLFFLCFQSCNGANKPKPIKYGTDQCAYCKMTVSDPRFGTQLQTKKGRTYNFDDVQCMIAFVKEKQVSKEEVGAFYLPDYKSNKLFAAEGMFYLKNEKLKSPMRGDIAAFSSQAELDEIMNTLGGGTVCTWEDLWK